MAIPFIPSRIARRVINREMHAAAGVTAVVGSNIHYGLNYPQGVHGPGLLFYMEFSAFDGALGTYQYEHLLSAQMRFVIRLDDEGTSDDRIADAWMAMMEALAGKIFDEPEGQVTFSAQGETPLSPYNEEGRRYQRLGTTFSVTVTRGG